MLRIVLAGDESVGKTSLITSFLKESFEEKVPACLPEISIPPEVTVDKVQTFIVDTAGIGLDVTAHTAESLISIELKKADVLCLVYSVDDEESIRRLENFWMPFLHSLGSGECQKPVILVGNKIDLRPSSASSTLNDIVMPLMQKFKEIETSLECSAKELINVAELFYFASKAVLHPTAPLFDSSSQQLTAGATKALERIFTICDKDRNGLLDDFEINEFQKRVFGSPLQQQELDGVKAMVRTQYPDAVVDNCISVEGFVYLHCVFVLRGRSETIWAVLRNFGYNDDLTYREEYLYPQIDMPSGSAAELSAHGYQFLTDLFQACDLDKDGALNAKELKDLFSITPGIPWISSGFPYSCITSDDGAVTLQGFLAMWSMTTLLDFKTTLAYLGYLGFDGNAVEAIKVSKIRSSDLRGRKNRSSRNVFRGLVFGATGSGKTEFLKGLVHKPFDPGYNSQAGSITASVNSIEAQGAEKYLVLQEVSPENLRTVLPDDSALTNCDVLCFLYDVSDCNSFSYIVNLRRQYDLDRYPVVFIGTKIDQGEVLQASAVKPEDYCLNLKLAHPLKISMKNRDSINEIYSIILAVAMNPSVAIPTELSRKAQRSMRIAAASGITLCVLACGSYFAYRHWKK